MATAAVTRGSTSSVSSIRQRARCRGDIAGSAQASTAKSGGDTVDGAHPFGDPQPDGFLDGIPDGEAVAVATAEKVHRGDEVEEPGAAEVQVLDVRVVGLVEVVGPSASVFMG